MPRDITPVHRCAECGAVRRVLVHTYDEVGDDGEPVHTIHGENVDHSRADCTAMQRLAREEWPTLFP